jgi:hypothetical protein
MLSAIAAFGKTTTDASTVAKTTVAEAKIDRIPNVIRLIVSLAWE